MSDYLGILVYPWQLVAHKHFFLDFLANTIVAIFSGFGSHVGSSLHVALFNIVTKQVAKQTR